MIGSPGRGTVIGAFVLVNFNLEASRGASDCVRLLMVNFHCDKFVTRNFGDSLSLSQAC